MTMHPLPYNENEGDEPATGPVEVACTTSTGRPGHTVAGVGSTDVVCRPTDTKGPLVPAPQPVAGDPADAATGRDVGSKVIEHDSRGTTDAPPAGPGAPAPAPAPAPVGYKRY